MKLLACLAIGILSLGVANTVSASLVAHWGFDEMDGSTAYDSVGDINGALFGGAIFTTTGILNGAVWITDGYVDMGNHFPSSSTFSIQAWVKVDSGDISPMTPVAKHWASVGQGYYLSVNNVIDGYTQANLAGFRSMGGSQSSAAIGGGLPINDGLWHQLVGTYNNGLTSLYVDGNLAGLGSGGYSDSSADFIIGGLFNRSGIPGNAFHGFIDEVKVFDNALHANDVKVLYNSTVNPVPIPGAFWLFGASLIGLFSSRIQIENRHASFKK